MTVAAQSYAAPFSEDAAARVADAIAYNADGLVPAVAQDTGTGEVLMLAWQSRAAVIQTLTTGEVTYYSRSRQKLWRKGESSGNRQYLVELRLDCDSDTLLLLVSQVGPACHTGRRGCFYRAARETSGALTELHAPQEA